MDVSDLRAFARLADLGGITAAARALAVPTSSVSRGLARLEAELGTTLVERSTRQLRLTAAGRTYRQHVERVLAELDAARTAMAEREGDLHGELRIDAPYAFTQYAIAPMLPAFARAHPDLRIRLSVNNQRIDPIAEDVDAVVRLGATRATGLITRRLASFDDWLCASPDYLERRGRPETEADLAGHDLVSSSHPVRWGRLEGALGKPRSCLILPEPAAIGALLLAGGGIGCVPSFMAAQPVARGELVRLFPGAPLGRHDIFIVSPSRTRAAWVRPFADALVASLSRLAAHESAPPAKPRPASAETASSAYEPLEPSAPGRPG